MNTCKINGTGPIYPYDYTAYIRRTNEKHLLWAELFRAYYSNELPIKKNDLGKRILDLGCGLGTNTQVLCDLFKQHTIYAIDRSAEMVKFATTNLIVPFNNLDLEMVAFEDYRCAQFDFILCSHVLQYIDSDVGSFVKRIYDRLNPGGEAWIVLQENVGLNTLITTARPYLNNLSHYFEHWFVHSNLRQLFSKMNMQFTVSDFRSFFISPDFENITEEDEQLMNFIFLGSFDTRNKCLMEKLKNVAICHVQSSLMAHDVGITKIKRLT